MAEYDDGTSYLEPVEEPALYPFEEPTVEPEVPDWREGLLEPADPVAAVPPEPVVPEVPEGAADLPVEKWFGGEETPMFGGFDLGAPEHADAFGVDAGEAAELEPVQPLEELAPAEPALAPSAAYQEYPELLDDPVDVRPELLPAAYLPVAEAEAQRRDQELAAAQLEEAQAKSALRAEQAHQDFVEVERATATEMKDIASRAKEQAKREVDRDRHYKNMSTGEVIASYVGAMIGGYLQPGGRNSMVELIQQQIRDDIEDQKNDIANGIVALDKERQTVAAAYEKSKSLYEAGLVGEISALKREEQGIMNRIATLDPNGTQHYKAEIEARKLGAAAEQRALELQDEMRKRHAAMLKEKRTQEAHESKLKSDAASRAGTYAGIQRAKETSQRAERKLTAEEMAAQSEEALLGRDPVTAAMKKQGYLQEDRAKVASVKFPDGTIKVALFGSPEAKEKFEGRMSSARHGVGLIDALIRIRDKEGWQSSWANSAALQQAEVLGTFMKMNVKDFNELGALTPADDQFIDGLSGGDVTQFKDVETKLKTIREQMQIKMRAELIQKNVPGASEFRFPKLKAPSTKAAGHKEFVKTVGDEIDVGSGYGTAKEEIVKRLRAFRVKEDLPGAKYWMKGVTRDLTKRADKYQKQIDSLDPRMDPERFVDTKRALEAKIDAARRLADYADIAGKQGFDNKDLDE